MSTNTDAPGQALGYMYQILYALYLLLDADINAKIYIEQLEDIQLQADGDAIEAFQLKHSIQPNPPNLSDRSLDLWKTIGNWSDKLVGGSLQDVSLLSLITVSQTSPDSIPSELQKPLSGRNTSQILDKMGEILGDILTKDEPAKHYLYPHLTKFQRLSPSQRKDLISRVRIISQSPDIEKLDTKIKNKLIVHPAFRDHIYEDVMGWWAIRARNHLINQNSPITKHELSINVSRINEQFRSDNLPLDFEDYEPPDELIKNQAQLRFVQQLTLISSTTDSIERAIRDYYRAFRERKKWLDEKLLLWDELSRHERQLIEYWEIYCDSVRTDLDIMAQGQNIDNEMFGKKLYNDLMKSGDIPRIKDRVAAGYIQRGSYHILADYAEPRVWWHPEFISRLQQTLRQPVIDGKELSIYSLLDNQLQKPSIEMANLLNPAFGTVVLYDAIQGYEEITGSQGLPLVKLYLVFPLVLTSSIRDSLPVQYRTSLLSWAQNHPEHIPYIRASFQAFEKKTHDALSFAMRKKTIVKVNAHHFTVVPTKRFSIKKYAGEFQTEVPQIRNAAKKLGKMLARVSSPLALYSLFEVNLL